MRNCTFFINLGWLNCLTALLLASIAPVVQAQVIPDNTLGNGNNSITTTVGNRTDITGGLQLNSALFHSFQLFNINTNQQVYFANPADVRNIFSRVTGGSLSNIDGLLGVAGQANLFLMNPNGIIFGPNARLDVAGSFFATTADALVFPDGQKFAATGNREVPLVEVNIPIGLQMGANPPAMLTNQGNLATGQDLTLAAGRLTLLGQLVAGRDLTLKAEDTVQIRDGATTPFLAVSGGNTLIQGKNGIDIFALSSPTPSFQSYGSTTLISDGIISADAHFLSGGSFSMLNLAGSPGTFVSLYDPIILVNGDVTFGDYTGTALKVEATGSITAGRITITGPDLNFAGVPTTIGSVSLAGTTNIASATISNQVGSVPVAVLEDFLGLAAGTLTGLGNGTATEGSALRAAFTVPAAGNTTQFNWNFLTSDGGIFNDFSFVALRNTTTNTTTVTSLAAAASGNASGLFQNTPLPAGDYIVGVGVVDVLDTAVNSSLTINNIAPILTLSTDPDAPALGRGPTLILRSGVTPASPFTPSPNVFVVPPAQTVNGTQFQNAASSGANNIQVAGINTSSTGGSGGDVILNAQGGNISIVSFDPKLPPSINTSSSFSSGTGGNVNLTATGNISLPNTRIISTGLAGSGDITIRGANVNLSNGTVVDAGAIGADGTSGNVTITALNGGSISLNQSALITSINTGAQPSRDPANAPVEGNITLQAGSISLLQSVLNASTNGGRNGGNVSLQAVNNISLDNESTIITTVGSQAGDPINAANQVKGGNIQITSSTLSLTNGSSLQAQNLSNQNTRAGNIRLDISGTDGATPALRISGIGSTRLPSGILASNEAIASAPGGGNIIVNVPNGTMSLSDRAVLSTRNQSNIQGGNITANVQNLQIDSGGQLITSATGSGRAGDISIIATGAVNISGSATPFLGPLISPFNQPGAPTTIDISSSFSSATPASANPNIEASNRFPFQTITATGTGQFAYYSFNVATAGSQGIFDIDGDLNNDGVADSGVFDTQIFLFNGTTGALLRLNDDSDPSLGGSGSSPNPSVFVGGRYDSYINYVFSTPGNYVLGVGRFFTSNSGTQTFLQGNTPTVGSTYNLQISLEAPGQSQGLIPNQGLNSGLFAQTTGFGQGGNISVQASSVTLSNNAEINASTTGDGPGGSISITATNTSGLSVNTPILQIDDSTISAGVVRTNKNSFGSSSGGSITLTANNGSIAMNNLALVNASTTGLGNGGNVLVQTTGGGAVSLTNGSRIEAQSQAEGAAGSITLNAPDITISGSGIWGNELLYSGLYVSSANQNTAQNPNPNSITINSAANPGQRLVISDGAVLSTLNQSVNPGGNITVNVNNIQLLNGGQIVTAAESTGGAGDITLNTANLTIAGTSNFVQQQNIANGNGQLIGLASNGTLTGAQPLGTNFSLVTDPNIESSTVIPHITISGTGNGTFDYYSFDITTGNRAIFDIDGSTGSTNNPIDSMLFLFDSAGNLLAQNDDFRTTAGGGGSAGFGPGGTYDSYLDYTFTNPGIYYIGVTSYSATAQTGGITPTSNVIPAGVTYTLQASIDQRNTRNANQGVSSGLFAQSTGVGGSAGNITVNMPGNGQVTLNNGAQISGSTVSGQGGSIGLNGLSTLQVNDSLIATSTTGNNGSAGAIAINAANSVQISGVLPNGILPSGTPPLGGLLAAADTGNGSAGLISINTSQLTIQNGAAIAAFTDSGTGSNIVLSGLNTLQLDNGIIAASTQSGQAGNLTINNGSPATSITLSNNSALSLDALENGEAGDIYLNTQQLILNNSIISAATQTGVPAGTPASSAARAGNVLINASGNVVLDNNSELSVTAGNGGVAGSLRVNAGRLNVNSGSQITVSSPQGQAGNLTVVTNDLRMDQGTLSAETGTGGANIDITVNPGGLLLMRNASLISANASGTANGGRIRINAPFVIGLMFENSDIVANATAGNGGTIDITTNAIFGLQFRPKRTPFSDITASSDFGVSGSVILNTLNTDVTKGFSTPAIIFADVSQLTTGACEAVGAKASTNSELRILGRGGIPSSPTAPLSAQTTVNDWVSLDVTPTVPTTVTFSNGERATLEPGQTYQMQATCVRSWQNQQRSGL